MFFLKDCAEFTLSLYSNITWILYNTVFNKFENL